MILWSLVKRYQTGTLISFSPQYHLYNDLNEAHQEVDKRNNSEKNDIGIYWIVEERQPTG